MTAITIPRQYDFTDNFFPRKSCGTTRITKNTHTSFVRLDFYRHNFCVDKNPSCQGALALYEVTAIYSSMYRTQVLYNDFFALIYKDCMSKLLSYCAQIHPFSKLRDFFGQEVKKSQKTPKKEIELAVKRQKEHQKYDQ